MLKEPGGRTQPRSIHVAIRGEEDFYLPLSLKLISWDFGQCPDKEKESTATLCYPLRLL